MDNLFEKYGLTEEPITPNTNLDKDKLAPSDNKSGNLFEKYGLKETSNEYVKDLPFTSDVENIKGIDWAAYKPYMSAVYDVDYLDRLRAANQSSGEQFLGFLNQSITGEIIGGTISGVGAIFELPVAIGTELAGGDADFRNFMTDLGDDIINWSRESTPIYRTNPNKAFDIGDSGWWFSNAVSVASTLGLLIPSRGAVKAIDFFGDAINALGKAGKLGKLGKYTEIGDTAKYWRDLAVGAGVMRNAENFRESLAVVNQTREQSMTFFNQMSDEEFNKYKQQPEIQELIASTGKDYTKEQLADHFASKAGWKSYAVNSVNIFFDAIQFAPLLRGIKPKISIAGNSAIKEAQAKLLGQTVKNPKFKIPNWLSDSSKFIASQGTEGIEEAINAIGEKEGMYYGKYLREQTGDSNFSDRVKSYLKDPHLWEQAFWGFLGGVAFGGAVQGINKANQLIYGLEDRSSVENRIAEINNRTNLLKTYLGNVQAVQDGINFMSDDLTYSGTEKQVEAAKKANLKLLRNNALLEMADSAARVGNFDYLKEYINSEVVKKQLQEDSDLSQEDITEFINDSNDILNTYESMYEKYYNQLFPVNISPYLKDMTIKNVISSQFGIKFNEDRNSQIETEVSKLKTNDVYFQGNKNAESVVRKAILNKTLSTINEYISSLEGKEKEIVETRSKNSINSLTEELNSLQNVESKSAESLIKEGLDKNIIELELEKLTNELSNSSLTNQIKETLTEKTLKEENKRLEEEFKAAYKAESEKLKQEFDNITEETENVEEVLKAFEDKLTNSIVNNSDFNIKKKRSDIEKAQKVKENRKKAANNKTTKTTKTTADKKTETTEKDPPRRRRKSKKIVSWSDDERDDAKALLDDINQGVKSGKANISNLNTANQEIDELLGTIGIDNEIEILNYANSLKSLIAAEINRLTVLDNSTETVDNSDLTFDDEELLSIINKLDNIRKPKYHGVFSKDDLLTGEEIELGLKLINVSFKILNKTEGDILNLKEILSYVYKTFGEQKLETALRVIPPIYRYLYLQTKKFQSEDYNINYSIDDIIGRSEYNTEVKIENRQQSDELNIFLSSLFDLYDKTDSEGNIIISNEDNAYLVDYIINKLKIGDNISLQIDTTAKNYKLYKDLINEVPIVIRKDSIDIGYINNLKYLAAELDLINKLVDNIDNKNLLSDELLVNLKSGGVNTIFNKVLTDISSNKELTNLFSYQYNPNGLSEIDLLRKTVKHVISILNFNTKEQTINREKIKQEIKNWKSKIGRDYSNNNKIRSQIQTDTQVKLDTTISYKSNGAIIRRKDNNGNPIYVPLNNTFGENSKDYNIPILGIRKNTDGTILERKDGSAKDIEFSKEDKFTSAEYSVVKGAAGDLIPVALKRNTVNSKISSDKSYSKKLVNYINKEVEEIFQLLKEGETFKSENLKRKINNLSNVIIVNKESKLKAGERVHFKINTNEKSIEWTDNNTLYKVKANKESYTLYKNKERQTNKKELSDLGISDLFWNMSRNVNYDTLSSTNEFIDPVTNTKYANYHLYLIRTNALITDVGNLLDNKGNKISNVTGKRTGLNDSGQPLIVNISTNIENIAKEKEKQQQELSNLLDKNKSKIENVTFESLISKLGLSNKYKSVYETFDSLGIKIHNEIIEPSEKGENAVFIPSENKIYLTKNWLNLTYRREEVLLHEGIHGILNSKLTDNNRQKYITSLRNFIRTLDATHSDPEVNKILQLLSSEEGDPEEVVTYAFSNPKFAQYLATKQASTDTKVNKTLWNKLAEIIKEALSAVLPKSKLDELVNIMNEVFENVDTNTNVSTEKKFKKRKLRGTGEKISLENENSLNEKVNKLTDELSEEDKTTLEKEATEEEVREEVKKGLQNKEHSKGKSNKFKSIIDKLIKTIKSLFIGFVVFSVLNNNNNNIVIGESVNVDSSILNNSIEFIISPLSEKHEQWAKTFLYKQGLYSITEETTKFKESTKDFTVKEDTVKTKYLESLKFFEKISEINDFKSTRGDKIFSYRLQWANDLGFNYIAAPNQGNRKGDEIIFKDVIGVAHFLLDSDVSINQSPIAYDTDTSTEKYSHSFNDKLLKIAKKNNHYIPIYTRLQNNEINVKYKKASDLQNTDNILAPLRQYNFNDVDFSKTRKAPNFKSAQEVILKNNKINPYTNDNGTYLIFSNNKNQYSQFSGASVVFIFEDNQGNIVVRDFAGSINDIELEGKSIAKSFNIPLSNITIGIHDVGSFSAKPVAKNNKLSSKQYEGFNKDDWTSGAILIPTSSINIPIINNSSDAKYDVITSEKKAKNYLIDKKIIDVYNNIGKEKYKDFLRESSNFRKWAKQKYGIDAKLIESEQNGRKAIFNKVAFRTIDKLNKYDVITSEESDYPFTYREEQHIVNVLTSTLYKAIDYYSDVTLRDVIKGQMKLKDVVYNTIYEHAEKLQEQVTFSDYQIDLIDKVLDELDFEDSKLWDKTLSNFRRKFRINITHDDYYSAIEAVERNWDEKTIFSKPSKDGINQKVKNLLNSTLKLDITEYSINENNEVVYNSTTISGFPETIDFNLVYPKLISELSTVTSKEEMLEKLIVLSDIFEPALKQVHDILKEDEVLLNAFYSNFNKQIHERYIDLYRTQNDKNIVSAIFENRHNFLDKYLADSWINQLQIYLENDHITNKDIIGLQKDYRELNKLVNNFDTNKNFILELISSMYDKLGITINPSSIDYFISNDKYLEDIEVPKNAKDVNEYKQKRFVQDNFQFSLNNLIKYLDDYKKTGKDFDEYGNLQRVASLVKIFSTDRYEPTNLNIKGNPTYSFQNPNFISNWFKLKANKDKFTEAMKQFALDPAMSYSNYLFNQNGIGLFNYELDSNGNKVITGINEAQYKIFKDILYGGSKNIGKDVSLEYDEIKSLGWELTNLIYYLESPIKSQNPNGITLFSPVLSDASNILALNTQKIPMSISDFNALYKDYNKFKNTPIFKAVENTVYQEIERMKTAILYMFELDADNNIIYKNGNPVIKQEIESNLILHYHYKLDKNGNRIYADKDGNLVGNVFKFHNIPSLNKLDELFYKGHIPYGSLYNLPNESLDLISRSIYDFILNEVNKTIDVYSKHKSYVSNAVNSSNNPLLSEYKYEHMIAEFAINDYIFNVEFQNLFGLNTAFYKDAKDTNKRAKEIYSNGLKNGLIGSVKSITLSDIILKSEEFKRISRFIDEESAIKYGEVNASDGISLITLQEYEKRLKGWGLYNDRYKTLINRLKEGEISEQELDETLKPLKEFYYNYYYNESLGINVPKQIKNSSGILIPQYLSEELKLLYDYMIENNIGQINFESAEKVGSSHIANIHKNGNLNIKDGILSEEALSELNKSQSEISYNNLLLQQFLPDHHKDAKNKFGSQLSKRILDNLSHTGKYKLKSFDLKSASIDMTGQEIENMYFKLWSSLVRNNSRIVSKELGVKFDKDLNPIVDEFGQIVLTEADVIEPLQREVQDRNMNSNAETAVQLNEDGEANMPFSFPILEKKIKSILLSRYTNNVSNLKFPGAHLIQTPNIFMNQDLKGVKASDLQQKRKDYKLRQLRTFSYVNKNFLKAQVMLPAWSKKLFDDTTGKLMNIEDIPLELRTMVGYRIPTEGKYSTIVFEVVGFLPEDYGSTIMLPSDFIAQSGSDFDIDTLYIMSYQFKKYTDKDGNVKLEKIIYTEADNEEDLNYRYNSYIREVLTSLDGYKALLDYFKNNKASKYQKLKEDIEVLRDNVDEYSYYYFDHLVPDNLDLTPITNYLLKNTDLLLSKEEFKNLDITDQNSIKAKQNGILDIFISILSDKKHIDEVLEGSSFEDIVKAKENVDKYENTSQDINPVTLLGQFEFRNRVINAITLKGQSVNRDNSLSIFKTINAKLNDDLVFRIVLDSKIPSFEEIKKNAINLYGKDFDSNTNVLTLRYLGNNPKGTNKNLSGRYINTYAAQSTANVLDAVKFPMPSNVNTYTFQIWRTMVDLGTSWNYATYYIQQPILKDLSEYYFDSLGPSSTNTIGREIEIIKRRYQTDLYKSIREKTGQRFDMFEKQLSKNPDKDIFIPSPKNNKKAYDAAYKFLGYNIEKIEPFSISSLIYALKEYSKDDVKSPDFYRHQLMLLENFKKLKETSEAIIDATKIIMPDRVGAGPDFNVSHALIKNIQTLNDKRILTKDDTPIELAIYPKLFKLDKQSAYPSLEAYLYEANITSINTLSRFFLTESNSFLSFKDRVLNYLGSDFRDNLILNAVDNYLNAYVVNNSEYFSQLTTEKKELVLGTNGIINLDLKLDDFTNIDEFETLSAANKLALVQDYFRYTFQNDTTNILNFLEPLISKKEFNSKGYMAINYINNDEDINYMIDSFRDMWYSDNPYLSSLAKDLLNYTVIKDGFKFGFNIGKVIPVDILYKKAPEGINLAEDIRAIHKRDNLYNDFVTNDLFNKFLRANHNLVAANNQPLVPTVETEYKTIIDKNTGKEIQIINGINWDNSEGLETMKSEYYFNFDDIKIVPKEELPPRINSASIIKVLTNKKIPTIRMIEEGNFDLVKEGKKTRTTRPYLNNYEVGDTVYIWNGDKNNNQYIEVVITSVLRGTGEEIFNEISELPATDTHFTKEGKPKLSHVGNLRKMNLAKNQNAAIIDFQVINPEVTYRKQSVISSTLYQRFINDMTDDIDEAYFYPVTKLEQYEFNDSSIIPSNNIGVDLNRDYYQEINNNFVDDIKYDVITSENLDDKLSDNLVNFLSSLNFTVEFKNQLNTGVDLISLTDLLYKTVLVKNSDSIKGLSKEAAYVAYSFLGKKNKIRTDLIYNIKQLDNYNKIYADYKKLSPNLNDYKINELITIDFIADAIRNNYVTPKDSYINRKADYWTVKGETPLAKKLNYYLGRIKQFLENLLGKNKLSKQEVNDIIDDIANDIISNNLEKFTKKLNEEEKLVSYEETLNKDKEAKNIIENFKNLKLYLTGSLELRKQGTLYRTKEETIHDLDFVFRVEDFNPKDKDLFEKGLINNLSVLKDIRKIYPNYEINNMFETDEALTLLGKIGDYDIDIFFSEKDDIIENNRVKWEYIFKAKLKMGRAKDIKDFANYVPYVRNQKRLATVKNMRHFYFNENQVNRIEQDNETGDYGLDIKYDTITSEELQDYKEELDFVTNTMSDLMKDMSYYDKNSTYYKRLKSTYDKLDIDKTISDYQLTDLRASLLHIARHNLSNIINLEKRFKRLKEKGIENLTQEERKDLVKTLQQANNFISSVARVETISYSDDSVSNKDINKINNLIKDMKSQEGRISNMYNSLRELYLEYLDIEIRPLSTNPEIIKNTKEFFVAQDDENFFQMMLDAMMDTNNPIIANVVKKVTIELGKKDAEYKDRNRIFHRNLKRFKDSGLSMEILFHRNKEGKKTGQLVQEFYQEYRDIISDYKSKISEAAESFGKDSEEYANAVNDYDNWRKDNIEQKYTKDFYEVMSIMTPIAKEKNRNWKEREDQILVRYKIFKDGKLSSYYDSTKITEHDRLLLRSIQDEKDEFLAKNNKDSKSYAEYKEKVKELFETIDIHFDPFVKSLNKAKDKDDFIMRNASITEVFWERIKSRGGTEFPISGYAHLNDLLQPYRDNDNIVMGDLVPDNVKEEVKKWIEFNTLSKKFLRKQYEKHSHLSDTEFRDRALALARSRDRFDHNPLKGLGEDVETSYYKEAKAKAKSELTEEEYNKWYELNHINGRPINEVWSKALPSVRDLDSGNIEPNYRWKESEIKSEYINDNYRLDKQGFPVPTKKWANPQYDVVKNNELYNYLVNELEYLVSHYSGTMIDRGYLPAVSISEKSFKDSLLYNIGWFNLNRSGENALFDKSDNPIYFVPFPFISKIEKSVEYEIPIKNEDETFEEYQNRVIPIINHTYKKSFKNLEQVREANKKIAKYNDSLPSSEHAENINYDLEDTIPMFMQAALNHKYKKDLEADVLLLRSELEHMQIKRVNGIGSTLYDYYKSKVTGKLEEAPLSASGSNIEKHYKKWLEMVFYEQFELDEGTWTKIARSLQNYKSLQGIGLNPFSALNNVVIGRIFTVVEAASGYHFDMKDYLTANQRYFNPAALGSYMADTKRKDGSSSSFENALFKKFDIIEDQTERAETDSKNLTKLNKYLFNSNAFYVMLNIGEHMMQNTTLLAMLNSHRVIDGKIMNYTDFVSSKLTDNKLSKDIDELRRINALNKEVRSKALEEFNSYPKLIDAYTFKDGFAVEKGDIAIDENSYEEFRIKVRGVNHKIHGIYNRSDKGIIQNRALGRLAMQFRNWMRPGWNKRFGSKFGKSYWNERRKEWDKGAYISFWEFATIPFTLNNKENWNSEEERNIFNAASAIVKDYGKFITNAKVFWETLNDTDKANVKRTVMEMIYFLSTIVLLTALRKGIDDDDELKQNKAVNILLYQLDRARLELITFSPIYGWFNESAKLLSSPTATWNIFEDTYKLSYQILGYPFLDEDERVFKGGPYSGESRIGVYMRRTIPGLTQYERLKYIDKMNKYYKLF